MTGGDDKPLGIDVLHGRPSDEELAALIAVVSEAYSTETEDAVAGNAPRRTAWDLSTRGLRAPLQRERGWNLWAR
ncbi:acyl-CoA carboxylase subunit epsilon [Microbacterium candidum]|uniref:Acyl-CoA carboxylase subunit epsilon n=1 Tax=Microbacterium candidum TaxID=3041922 RepID=A0ABT7N0R4_9MICO|nr:acyl-CoA carboxylase subunit epsilon [Microbacterium sp. ASV49]MDL9980287.1 acyl-CoA carboxylase subunit epsilon [Microbacterium sp. ASV49]